MSWKEIKKKREEEEKKKKKGSSNSIVNAMNNISGGFWKSMGQSALAEQREKEEKKEREEQIKKTRTAQAPMTYKRSTYPSETQMISNNNKLANEIVKATTGKQSNLQSLQLANKNDLKNVQNADSLWTKIQLRAKNIGYTIDNMKNSMINGTLGVGQTIIRNSTDINNFASNIAKSVAQKTGKVMGVPEEETGLIVDRITSPMKREREEDLERLTKLKNNRNSSIQQNINQSKLNGIISGDKTIGPKIVEISSSVGQQIPGMLAYKVNPFLSFMYFKGSAEANYYDDAKERGMTEGQSKVYSKLMSYVESGTELFSVGNIQKGGKAIKAAANGFKNSGLKSGIKAGIDIFKNTAQKETTNMIKDALKDYGIGIAEEAFQEAITEPIQELAAMNIAGEDKADWNNIWQRMVQSGVDGALSSAIIAGANLGVSSCQGLIKKVENGHIPTQGEYNEAFKEASKKVDVQKLTIDGIKREVGNYKRYLQNNQNVNEQVINQEIKTAQNGFSQEENQAKQDLTNKLAQVRQFYDEDTYNQMRNFIETAPSEKALNQINEDMKAETKNRLEEAYKSERFTESQTRKQTYAKYQRQNNTTGIEYNSDVVNNALDTVAANRNGRRTVGQWKQVAEQIGLEASNLPKAEIDNIAYGSWFDLQPSKNITQYDNRTKEHKGFEKFTSDDWINTIYESAKGQKLQKLDTVLNQAVIQNNEEIETIKNLTKYNMEEINNSNIKMAKTEEILKNLSNMGKRDSKSIQALTDDIKEHGFKEPIYISNETNKIVDGNHRLLIAQELGVDEVPVKYINSSNDIDFMKNDWYNVLERRLQENGRNEKTVEKSNGTSKYEPIDNNRSNEIIDNRGNNTESNQLYKEQQENNDRPSTEAIYGENTSLGQTINQNQNGGTSNEASFVLPNNQENIQQTQENTQNTKGETINWNEIERPENNQKFRKHYRSIIESSNTTAEAKAIAKELMGTDTYTPESNKSQIQRADNFIEKYGVDKAVDRLMTNLETDNFTYDGVFKRVGVDDIALGERLIQYFSKTGDAVQLQNVMQATAMAGTEAGRAVQILSMLNHQTPQGQATWIQRSVDKMNTELAKKKGGTITTDADGNLQVINKQGKDITNKVDLFNLTPEMIEKIMSSENQDQMWKNIDEVYEELGQQVPLGMLEKVDSWRYFSMLANARTHIRNMVGNVAMGKMQSAKDKLAGGIEDVVSKFNPEMERTKTLRRADKKTKEFAKNDFKNADVQSMLELNENKYKPQSRLQNARRTFKSDVMENTLGRLFNLNDNLLEAEDGLGLKAGYQKALADYITANKIDVDNITDAQLNKARNYAIQQAKEATFHQANAIASAVTQFQNKNNLTKFAIDALLPFKKTPMNVAKAGMEYSPLQIAKSATIDVVNLRKGNISINQYIDNLSKGMTGTGIALAGYALAKAGILKASGGDDKDKEKYDE